MVLKSETAKVGASRMSIRNHHDFCLVWFVCLLWVCDINSETCISRLGQWCRFHGLVRKADDGCKRVDDAGSWFVVPTDLGPNNLQDSRSALIIRLEQAVPRIDARVEDRFADQRRAPRRSNGAYERKLWTMFDDKMNAQ
jgi:hypothetical protein